MLLLALGSLRGEVAKDSPGEAYVFEHNHVTIKKYWDYFESNEHTKC